MQTTADVINQSFANLNAVRKQKKDDVRNRQVQALQHYEKFRTHLEQGAGQIKTTIESSETPIQFGEETRKLMFTSAEKADMMAKQLGLPPTNVQAITQAFSAKNGTALAQSQGRIAAAETVAQQQAQSNAGLPQLQGQNEAQQANARLAATDQVAAGEADSQQEMATREANARYVINAQGLQQGSPEAEQIRQQFLGADKRELDLSTISIAAVQTGIADDLKAGNPVPPEKFDEFINVTKKMKVSDDLVSQMISQMSGGVTAPAQPSTELTEVNIQATMRANNMTREEVLEAVQNQ